MREIPIASPEKLPNEFSEIDTFLGDEVERELASIPVKAIVSSKSMRPAKPTTD